MAKSKSQKLPKKIAGVKVPKRLRKPGGKALVALRHPLVADIAAAALIAAAGAIRDSRAVRSAAGEVKDKAGDAAGLGTVIAATAAQGAKRLGSTLDSLAEDGSSSSDAGKAAKKSKGKGGKKSKSKGG